MKKKPALAPIPPLSLQALARVQEIQNAARNAIRQCSDTVRMWVIPEEASRILRTCLVALLDAQLDYYSSLPTYHPQWMAQLENDTIESLLGVFPLGTSGEQFRPELHRTAKEHLKTRVKATPSGARLQPERTINQQIELLRNECRLTVEELAEALDVATRSVYRHLSGEASPRHRQIAAYEKLFSQKLGRKVRLETSLKRQ